MSPDWLPAYSIRRSKRAKRINVRLCPDRGLQLILPIRSSESAGLAFLHEHKDWILKHQNLLQPKLESKELPAEIHLTAFEKKWNVRYESVIGYKKVKLLQLPNDLVIFSEKPDLENCLKELKQWLYMVCEKEFYLWLKQLSERCQLTFNKLTIRNQMTRWGSCSHEKNININFKLAFLPRPITEYVLVHELCHTRFLDHSENFWNLVGKFIPDHPIFKQQMQQMKQSDFPAWIK